MSVIDLNLESKHLHGHTHVTILLPNPPRGHRDGGTKDFYESGKKYKVFWLFHGSTEDHTSWMVDSHFFRIAAEHNMMVVCPDALNSEFVNWPEFGAGYNFWDYFGEELVPLVHNWFPASPLQEDNYIGGLSMGGNGALMTALGHPGMFAGVAVFSSAARDYSYLHKAAGMSAAEFRRVAGDAAAYPGPHGDGLREKEINAICKYGSVESFLNSNENAWDRMKTAAENGTLPPIYHCFGTADSRAARFGQFAEYMKELGIRYRSDTFEGLDHEWAVWEKGAENALEYFGL